MTNRATNLVLASVYAIGPVLAPSGSARSSCRREHPHQEATMQPDLSDQLAQARSPAAAGNMPAHA